MNELSTKATERVYKCTACGHETIQVTNHTMNTYSWGGFNTCPKCPPWRKFPEYGGSTVWEYVKEHERTYPEN